MPCRELVELVTEYLENSLGLADRAAFEAHLAACEDCGIFFEQMRRTIDALGRLGG